MKIKRNDGKFAAKMTRIVGMVAVSALTGAAVTYIALADQLASVQVDDQLMSALSDAGRSNLMLKELKTGRTKYITGVLSGELANDFKVIGSLSDKASPEAKDFSKSVLAVLERQQKTAPDLRLVSARTELSQ